MNNNAQSAPDQPDTVTRYHANNRFDASVIDAIVSLFREIRDFRSHINTIFSAEFRSSYRGTALGVFWNFALPLLPVSVYILLSKLRVFPIYQDLPREVFISFNVTMWFVITNFITKPMQIVKSQNTTAMKTALPLSSLIVASFARVIFDTLVRLGLIIALMIATKSFPAASAPLFLVVMLAAMTFSLSIGFLLSILNVIYPDIERVTTIILRYGIFLSGVIFPLSSLGPLAGLETINPFAVFITAGRDIVFLGKFEYPLAFALWSAAGAIVFLFAVRFFYVMEQRIRSIN